MLPKFRAWDKNNAYMECTDKNLTVVFAQEGIQVVDHTTFSSSCTNMEDYVLMQSTGLKDKNGKEIFESEIVDVSTVGGRFYLRGIVKKVKGGFYIEELTRSNVTPLTDFYFKSYTNTLEIKILGNIYEHRGLLDNDS